MTCKTNKHIIQLAIFLIISFAILMPVVVQAQTKIYKEYEHRTDLTAMCILNFTIADSVKVDITVLVPNDADAACELVKDFGFGNAMTKEDVEEAMRNGTEGLIYRNTFKNNPKKRFGPITSPDDYKRISVVAYNIAKGAILIFHNVDTMERDKFISSLLTKSLIDKEVLPDSNCK